VKTSPAATAGSGRISNAQLGRGIEKPFISGSSAGSSTVSVELGLAMS
jgi:hypothetical protein